MLEYWSVDPGETKAKEVSRGKNNGCEGILPIKK
jgi:hypothetical protein